MGYQRRVHGDPHIDTIIGVVHFRNFTSQINTLSTQKFDRSPTWVYVEMRWSNRATTNTCLQFGSTALKLIQTFFYAIAFCCSAIILGFYSYFLAIQADRDRAIPQWQKAVEG